MATRMKNKGMCIGTVVFDVPLDTLKVISETIIPANHLTGAEKNGLRNQSLAKQTQLQCTTK